MAIGDNNEAVASAVASAPVADPSAAADSAAGGQPAPPSSAPASEVSAAVAEATAGLGEAMARKGLGDGTSPEAPATAAPAPPAPAFPSHEEFGWDDWDGQDWDALPEGARGWVKAYYDRTVPSLQASLKKAQADATTAMNLYNALGNHEEDPRVAQYAAQISDYEIAMAERDQRLEALERANAEYRQQDNARYFEKFQSDYATQLADEKIAKATQELMVATFPPEGSGNDVWESWTTTMLEPHESIQVAVYGPDAVALGLELAKEGMKAERIIDFVKARFGASTQPARPPAGVVNGGASPARAGAPPKPAKQTPQSWDDVRTTGSFADSLATRLAGGR